MSTPATSEERFEGVHCTLRIQRPAPGIVVLIIRGTDAGELGDAPFRSLAADVGRAGGATGDREGAGARLELFVDARDTRSASLTVSSEWAQWLGRHKHRLRHVSMLTGSRFIQLTADFVRRFADLGEVMRIYTDPAAFDGALAHAVGNADLTGAEDQR